MQTRKNFQAHVGYLNWAGTGAAVFHQYRPVRMDTDTEKGTVHTSGGAH